MKQQRVRKPFLPIELIYQILKDDRHLLMLLNKEFTSYYVQYIYLHRLNMTNMPVFVNPVFPYYSFITALVIKTNKPDIVNKWVYFPYYKLVNCTSISLEFLEFPRQENFKYYAIVALRRIKCQMKWLKFIKCDVVDDACLLYIFQKSRIERLEFREMPNNIYLLNTMHHLNCIYLDTYTVSKIPFSFPRISKLRTDGIPDDEDIFEVFCSIGAVFPNLTELNIYGDLPNVLPLIPLSVKTLQINFFSSNISFRPSDCHHFDFLAFSFGLNNCTADSYEKHVSNILTIIERNAKNWLLGFGIPTFLVITNVPEFKDILKYTYALSAVDSSSEDIPINPLNFESRRHFNTQTQVHMSKAMLDVQEDTDGIENLFEYVLGIIRQMGLLDALEWAAAVMRNEKH